jgi:hypothetical protein
MQINSLGLPNWSVTFGTNQIDRSCGLAIDKEDNIVVMGSSYGNMINTEDESAHDSDVFVTRFDAVGNQLWTKQFGTDQDDIG